MSLEKELIIKEKELGWDGISPLILEKNPNGNSKKGICGKFKSLPTSIKEKDICIHIATLGEREELKEKGLVFKGDWELLIWDNPSEEVIRDAADWAVN
jgi:hypothetical protein